MISKKSSFVSINSSGFRLIELNDACEWSTPRCCSRTMHNAISLIRKIAHVSNWSICDLKPGKHRIYSHPADTGIFRLCLCMRTRNYFHFQSTHNFCTQSRDDDRINVHLVKVVRCVFFFFFSYCSCLRFVLYDVAKRRMNKSQSFLHSHCALKFIRISYRDQLYGALPALWKMFVSSKTVDRRTISELHWTKQ